MNVARRSRLTSGLIKLLLLLTAVICSGRAAMAAEPYFPPRPNLTDAGNFVSDEGHYVPARAVEDINRRILEMSRQTTCEMAVCVVKSLNDMSIEDYAYELFKKWGLGKKDKNNGVLLLMAIDDHKARIEVGSGAEGVLTDIVCSKIIRNDILPAMRSGQNVGQALSAATRSICEAMTNPEVARELQSDEDNSAMSAMRSLDRNVLWEFLLFVVSLVFLFTLVLFFIDLRHAHNRDNYRRAMVWRNHIATYWWSVLLSLGATLPIALLVLLLYRYARDVTEICPTCGGKMKKLPEDEDNALLSSSQDFEEKIGSVDYDVWLCPDCGTVERFPYVEKQLKYHECPSCGTIAMNLVCNKVIEPPTATRPGHGERIYQCQYCRHIKKEHYNIPPRGNDGNNGAALAAGAIIGSMLGGRGGGGGFSGGSFGGGHSSGGGASGGW